MIRKSSASSRSRSRQLRQDHLGEGRWTRFGVGGLSSEYVQRRRSSIREEVVEEGNSGGEIDDRGDWVLDQFYEGMCSEELDNLSDYSL